MFGLRTEQASIVIAPLLASAGTNIKILEAMAMGKAIVSTTGGVNGLDLTPGVEAIVENDPVRMAAEIQSLLGRSEPPRCTRTASAANCRETVQLGRDRRFATADVSGSAQIVIPICQSI